jgi:hypothetical protein
MYRSILLILIIVISLSLDSCLPKCDDYIEGSLPEIAVNLEEFNSEYDDYNSTAVPQGAFIPFCFSTNRNSEGDNFDIVYEPMSIGLDEITEEITVLNNDDNWESYNEEFMVVQNALDQINSDGDELGPYFLLNQNSFFTDYYFLFMYASDEGGDFQISFTYNTISDEDFVESHEIEFLNSPYDDLYPIFNMYYTKMFFCSNRDDDIFNIYSADIIRDIEQLLTELTDPEEREITLNETLSSDYNDKCPYIYGRLMVFASDRPGGEGGYDLYYSINSNEQWSEPVNFGPDINSPYDEYRPILINDAIDYYKDMMVFSSNRPGGKGGFDLYYVGI